MTDGVPHSRAHSDSCCRRGHLRHQPGLFWGRSSHGRGGCWCRGWRCCSHLRRPAVRTHRESSHSCSEGLRPQRANTGNSSSRDPTHRWQGHGVPGSFVLHTAGALQFFVFFLKGQHIPIPVARYGQRGPTRKGLLRHGLNATGNRPLPPSKAPTPLQSPEQRTTPLRHPPRHGCEASAAYTALGRGPEKRAGR